MTTKDVLLVDDDASIREVIQLTLELVGGWHVHLAASGVEALEQVQERRPDAILLDMMMPGMDGATTLARLREAGGEKDVPVILLSAKLQQRRDDDQLDGLGVAGVIGKPFDPIALPGQIRTILGWAE
ncbi:response regulator [Microlunatus elymi]|uniref:Response regulator n=2 Tax=Microlunatus elymi TaxID=2596828 RepID=A0A516Q606_9ACTN|nr:response regulator [Microlunatus elymi]